MTEATSGCHPNYDECPLRPGKPDVRTHSHDGRLTTMTGFTVADALSRLVLAKASALDPVLLRDDAGPEVFQTDQLKLGFLLC